MGMVVLTFNLSTWEAEAGRVHGLPGLPSDFQDHQGKTERTCFFSPLPKMNIMKLFYDFEKVLHVLILYVCVCV